MKRYHNLLKRAMIVFCMFGLVFFSSDTCMNAYAADAPQGLELLDEFDFSDLDTSLEQIFPRQKMTFQDVIITLTSGSAQDTVEVLFQFVLDQIFYEFTYNRKNIVYMLLIAIIAAIFSNFSGVFQNRQASEISFYVLYMLLITLCLGAFRITSEGVEAHMNQLLDFMQVLCPVYFLAVTIVTGSVTSMFFYHVVLLSIYIVEVFILNFLLPLINVYLMVQVLSNLTGEVFLSHFCQLIEKIVSWSLKTLTACIVGLNVMQGLLAPVLDSLKRGTLTRTLEALPGIGNTIGSAGDLVLSAAVLIKNGIGMAGAVIAIIICAVPVIQLLVLSFLYKAAAAIVQPISDKRITECIGSVSESYELIVKLVFTTGILFLLSLAIISASTT